MSEGSSEALLGLALLGIILGGVLDRPALVMAAGGAFYALLDAKRKRAGSYHGLPES